MSNNDTYMACAAQHFGAWAVDPLWFSRAVAAVKAGTFEAAEPETSSGSGYEVEDGIAQVPIVGHMIKGDSSFGGTSSIRARKALRSAANDPAVKGVMLVIDSPGGTVAGTAELADEVRAVGRRKPVHAYGEDLMASAAYWVGAQARRVSVNKSAEVGSIGTFTVVEDTSGLKEKYGVKTYVVSTGKYKGAFVDGAPVTEEQLDYIQELVDDLNDQFLSAVSKGRRRDMKDVREWADGRTWIGTKAASMGLVDGVETYSAARRELVKEINRRDEERAARRLVDARLNRLETENR